MGNNIVVRGTDAVYSIVNGLSVLTTPATGPNYGFPTQYASKVENLMCNQQGDNVYVTPLAGDCLVAIAIGLKSYQPFDLLHGQSPSFGYLQGLNDFNANPVISDGSPVTSVPVTAVLIQATTYALTSATVNGPYTLTQVGNGNGTVTIYTGSFPDGGSNLLVGQVFTIAGFNTPANNGTWICTANNTTTLTLANPTGVAETASVDSPPTHPVATSQSTVYHGTMTSGVGSPPPPYAATSGAANAFAGFYFTIAGFDDTVSPPVNAFSNNGTFLCTASTASSITLSNANGVAATQAATATDYILTVTAANSFAAGDEVVLEGMAEPWLNSVDSPPANQLLVTAGGLSGSQFCANFSTYEYDYQNLHETGYATREGGNTWTLVANLNLADSDYTGVGSSKWSLDGYYPSVYIWVAQNVEAGPYNVNLNSCYDNGIDPPQDLAAGKPIFDGGVNFQVFALKGAATSGAVESSSYGNIGTTTSNPATAPNVLATTAANGDVLITVGLMKSGNVFGVGTVGVSGAGSPPVPGAAMTRISNGRLVGSEAHYAVEYAPVVDLGSFDPNFSNPLGYEMVVASIAIKSS